MYLFSSIYGCQFVLGMEFTPMAAQMQAQKEYIYINLLLTAINSLHIATKVDKGKIRILMMTYFCFTM